MRSLELYRSSQGMREATLLLRFQRPRQSDVKLDDEDVVDKISDQDRFGRKAIKC
jgi:hypothetical protein